MRQSHQRRMLARYFLSAVSEPIVVSIAQKRAGLVIYRPSNAIRRERVVAVLPRIGE